MGLYEFFQCQYGHKRAHKQKRRIPIPFWNTEGVTKAFLQVSKRSPNSEFLSTFETQGALPSEILARAMFSFSNRSGYPTSAPFPVSPYVFQYIGHLKSVLQKIRIISPLLLFAQSPSLFHNLRIVLLTSTPTMPAT